MNFPITARRKYHIRGLSQQLQKAQRVDHDSNSYKSPWRRLVLQNGNHHHDGRVNTVRQKLLKCLTKWRMQRSQLDYRVYDDYKSIKLVLIPDL